jgi:single-strand DNA-binding protein
LTAPASRRPGDTGRPGRARTQARPAGKRRGPWRTTKGPPPEPAPADPPTQEGGPATDRTTTATDHPAAPTSPREGTARPDTHVTIVGNLTDDPEVSFTPAGAAVCNFRVAVTARIKDGEGWRDGDTSFYRITAWRQLAEHIGDSLAKGNRVIVVGQLRARSWETPEGERRSVVEVQAEEVGPSLRWATAKPERATNGKSAGQFNDDPPF